MTLYFVTTNLGPIIPKRVPHSTFPLTKKKKKYTTNC